MKKKTALICTIYNESDAIEALLNSIHNQSQKPDEIIFVDAGSTDNTVHKINSFSKENSLACKVYIKPGFNRSQGRNYAIKKASANIIAVTDAGCILETHWFERITLPLLQEKADAVAGYYLPLTPTPFQHALAPYVSVMPKNFNPAEFLPSSRSIAFTKRAWELAGKYPKKLEYCEDLVFAQHLKKNTQLVIVKNAIVYWTQKKTYLEFFQQISGYAQGDIEANYQPHTLKIATVFGRYAAFLIYPPVFLIYLIWSMYKHRDSVKQKSTLMYMPALQITADLAVMWGALKGLKLRSMRRLHIT